MPITIPLARINRVLGLTWLALTLAGLGVEVWRYGFGRKTELTRLLSLSYECNVPTWYSAALLLGAALLLALIAALKTRPGGTFRGHWILLAAGFLFISVDETAQLHENLNDLMELRGIFYFSWVIPAGILVLILGLSYVRFLLHLPARTRWRFVWAAVAFVGGAIGVELILGYWTDLYGDRNLGYALIDLVEESLEIAGLSLFLAALLDYLATQAGELRLAFVAGLAAGGAKR